MHPDSHPPTIPVTANDRAAIEAHFLSIFNNTQRNELHNLQERLTTLEDKHCSLRNVHISPPRKRKTWNIRVVEDAYQQLNARNNLSNGYAGADTTAGAGAEDMHGASLEAGDRDQRVWDLEREILGLRSRIVEIQDVLGDRVEWI